MHELTPGSKLSDKFLKVLPRDMSLVLAKAEELFQVLESRQKLAKTTTVIYMENSSTQT